MKFLVKLRGLNVLGLTFFVLLSTNLAAAGGSNSGGGDKYVADFVKVATKEVYPWLKLVGSQLKPMINAEEFLGSVDARKIKSVKKVYESCQFSNDEALPINSKDREVEACYDGELIYISRSLYPLHQVKNRAKQRLVAHEIFRKMKLEGDQYEISKQLDVLSPKVKAKCQVCGNSSETGSEAPSACTKTQETELSLGWTGSLRSLYFGRLRVEVWGVQRENPRIFVYDSERKVGASGEIDIISGEGLLQLLIHQGGIWDAIAHVSCELGEAK